MDESLEPITLRVLEEARAKGRDLLSETELAVRAGRRVRPDPTASEILAAVPGAAPVTFDLDIYSIAVN